MAESNSEKKVNYTDLCINNAFDFNPYEDDYAKKLLEMTKIFRTFGTAIETFLDEQGFEATVSDTQSKIDYLKNKFRESKIPVPRSIEKWFDEDFSLGRKSTAFLICMAFDLSVDEADDFLRRICLSRSFDCHCREDVIFYYGISHGLKYNEIKSICDQVDKMKPDRIHFSKEIKYTATIRDELALIASTDEFVQYMLENLEHFNYNNVTATEFISYLWKDIAQPGGIAEKERSIFNISFDDELANEVTEDKKIPRRKNKDNSVWMIYLQILGLQGESIYQLESDRSIKSILSDNELMSVMAVHCFPDRDGIEKILGGKHVSEERVRKLLILLVFYHELAKMAYRDKTYMVKGNAPMKVINAINTYLMDAGYPELYPGNPYDWMFLFVLEGDNPLQIFRENIMREIYYAKENEHK